MLSFKIQGEKMIHKRKFRSGYNLHHLRPRSRGGSMSDENLCYLKIKKHHALHKLFFNLTPEQIVKFLSNFNENMLIVFGTTDLAEALKIYIRLLKMKGV